MSGWTIDSVEIDATFLEDPRAWLAGRASREMPYLLAHADDGVIWGRWEDDGALRLTGEVFPEVQVDLRAETLRQARVFGPGGELRVWRRDEGFDACRLQDRDLESDGYFDVDYLLWQQGAVSQQREGFALLREGQRGLVHAPPVVPVSDQRPALQIRHYVTYDEQDQAKISLSRLVDLHA
jgi:CRISPR-associated protein (TIGR03984 family)